MPRLSRRQLLKTAAISTALSTPAPLLAASREKLVVPPLIEVRRGRLIVLTMQETNYPLDGSHNVTVWDSTVIILAQPLKSNQVCQT